MVSSYKDKLSDMNEEYMAEAKQQIEILQKLREDIYGTSKDKKD